MLELYRNSKLKLPQIQPYTQAQFYEAHEALGSGLTTGKVVVRWD
jgi:hypothetical protein